MEKIPQNNQEKIDDNKNVLELEDSSVAIEKEGLEQNIQEIELDKTEYDEYRKKALIDRVKRKISNLKDFMNPLDILDVRGEFANRLKNKYGEKATENALYHILIGSTPEDHFEVKDFEGEDSIEDFVDDLFVKFDN